MQRIASLFLAALCLITAPRHDEAHETSENPAATAAAIARMTDTARNFLNSLAPDEVARARYVFDDEKRLVYRIIPFSIPGLRLGEMTPGQQALVHAMINSSLSAAGYQKTASIIRLEEILVELEEAGGATNPAHGAGNYTVAIFGEPSAGGTWSWRMHGHHLYLSFTVVDGRFVASGPAFLGAEPHVVPEGGQKGWRVLANEEDLGRALINALPAGQREKAVISKDVPRDLFSGSYTEFSLEGPPKGIAFGELGHEHRQMLRRLIMEYVNNLPPELAGSRLGRVEAGGWNNIHFAWMGSIAPGARNYYRVQGPEFLIEYCAVALSENHVHTVWREFNGDFGRDLLKEHYENFPH